MAMHIVGRPQAAGKASQSGFSLVELLIASTLSLLILAGLVSVFVSSSQSRNEVERASQQIENGRYAMQLITGDLRNAGYLAEYDPRPLTTPAAKPDPCATNVADLRAAMPLHIQGYDVTAGLSCLSDVRSGTDVLVVRRASTCVAGSANCDAAATGVPHFQASLCNTELTATPYALDSDTSALTLHKKNCTTVANLSRYRTHIYFVANNDLSGDGIPTLKRAELGTGGFTVVPLVEGIENIQFEYGIDRLGSTGACGSDGSPDVFTANPDTYNDVCAGSSAVQNWRNVVAVKVNLLARNTTISSNYVNNKTYTLGLTAAGEDNDTSAPGDHYKRHVYRSNVRLNNPAGRSSTP